MLRPMFYAELDRLELSHLVDGPVTVFAEDGRLHATARCSALGNWGNHVPRVTMLRRPPRELVGTLCDCLSGTTDPTLQALFQARNVLKPYLEEYPKDPAPEGSSLKVLLALARRVTRLDWAREVLAWTVPTDPEVVRMAARLRSDLSEELEVLRARIRESGAAALDLQHVADVTLWSDGMIDQVFRPVGLILGGDTGYLLARRWEAAVVAGLDVDQRRRDIAKYAGGVLVSYQGVRPPAEEIRRVVLSVLELVSVLETRFAAELESPNPTVVMASSTPLRLADGGQNRLVTEACTVATSGPHRLLVGPRRVLQRHLASTCDLADPYSVPMILLPEDPVRAEIALGLWDPTSESTLSTPAGIVEASALL